MSLIRADHWIPQFVYNVILTNGTTYISPAQLQNGAASVTLQFLLSDGAAGTCYAEATNMDPQNKTAQWVPCQSFTLAANNSGAMVFASVDQLTGMHAMRVRVAPTASGTINVALNFRHYSH